jgi:hypothetical protein
MAEAERRSLSKQVELLLERCVAHQEDESSTARSSLHTGKSGAKKSSGKQ